MKIFRLSNGMIVQIIDKEKIQRWKPEMPVVFVNYLMDKKLETYGTPKDQAAIRAYLNEILEEVAVPKLTGALKSDDPATRQGVATSLLNISKKRPEMVKPVLKYLDEADVAESVKGIKDTIQQVKKNYERSIKKKEYEVKRKKMRELDKKLVDGSIKLDEYARERKEFLSLGEELEEEG